MTQKNIKVLFVFMSLFLFTACEKEENNEYADKQPVQLHVNMNKQTRTLLDGSDFADGDVFNLYEGAPASTSKKSDYSYNQNSDKWNSSPGLYWDDLDIWNADGSKKTGTVSFTGILTNGGALNLTTPSFAIAADQSKKEDFLKNDLLVADGQTTILSPLDLTFKHVFAQFKVVIKDLTTAGPDILGTTTALTLDKAILENQITFSSSGTTVATAGTNKQQVTFMRSSVDVATKTYTYIIILPAQSLRDAKLTITNNANQKTYNYSLSNVTILGNTSDPILAQGHITTLSLDIEKTEITIGTVTVNEWNDINASGTATPNDYPVIEIGGGDGGDDGGGIDDQDDYAGKIIRLTEDVDAKDLGLPIGNKEVPFRGTFDGQGFTIYGIDLDSNKDFLGVFGYTDGATIKNLNVKGVGINNTNETSNTATGGLAGYINNTLIDNCHVLEYSDGVKATQDNAGGLVGYVNGASRIRNSSSNVFVEAGHNYAGGLIGIVRKGSVITHSFSTKGAIAGNFYAGGLVGACYETDIEYCYSWGSAEAVRFAGGLIGRYEGVEDNYIRNNYAAGQYITATSNTAGLIGYTNLSPVYGYWNAILAAGRGIVGVSLGVNNASFTLTTTQAAMENVCNNLNTAPDGTVGDEWALKRITEYNNYVLPVLKLNEGKAEPKSEE